MAPAAMLAVPDLRKSRWLVGVVMEELLLEGGDDLKLARNACKLAGVEGEVANRSGPAASATPRASAPERGNLSETK